MTNIVAAIIVTVATNWTTTGTFTPVSGGIPEEFQAGRIVTNSTAILVWKGARHEVVVESVSGPVCGERRIPKPIVNQWATNYTWPKGGIIYMTNAW